MYAGVTPTKFGRYHVPETPSSLAHLHFHKGAPLKEVDHEPKVGVLDQEDLLKQGIRCSTFIPHATDADALGSCTANATTAALSNVLDEADFLKVTGAESYQDVKGAEEFAIRFYHLCTSQTADPATEWPPTDCGSSGPYIVKELQAQGLAHGDRIAHGGQNLVSLLQTDGVLAGIPFLNAWMQPDSQGFVDGDGTAETLREQIAEGVAGGHEIYLSGIPQLAMVGGRVDPFNTVIKFRNSWSSAWALGGSALFHLSTLVALGSYADFRQLVK
jgi:hypothetical protein